jgi:hypothetical protein
MLFFYSSIWIKWLLIDMHLKFWIKESEEKVWAKWFSNTKVIIVFNSTKQYPIETGAKSFVECLIQAQNQGVILSSIICLIAQSFTESIELWRNIRVSCISKIHNINPIELLHIYFWYQNPIFSKQGSSCTSWSRIPPRCTIKPKDTRSLQIIYNTLELTFDCQNFIQVFNFP